MDVISTNWLASIITARSTRAIAVQTRDLVANGILPMGAKLPPLRDLAFAMHISPATLSNAWKELRKNHVITGKGRNGSWVSGIRTSPAPVRFMDTHLQWSEKVKDYSIPTLDLGWAVPDFNLLPRLDRAMQHGVKAAGLNSYERERILPELKDVICAIWPYQPEEFLVTNGGYSAIHIVLNTLNFAGAKIAVEEPTAIRIIDILEDIGAKILPVPCDMHGPLPSALEEVLEDEPQAFLYQPRVHSVTGAYVDQKRSQQLANVLKASKTLVIEDDGLGDISAQQTHSLGKIIPERVVHIRSFSKSLGPDLRVAVLSAPLSIILKLQSFRAFSSGWTSRIMQSAVAWLLQDNETARTLSHARSVYRKRRKALCSALAQRNIEIDSGVGEGLCLWLPVEDEKFAIVTLASRNIAVLPGSKCSIRNVQALRIATGNLVDEYGRVADALALSVKTKPHL